MAIQNTASAAWETVKLAANAAETMAQAHAAIVALYGARSSQAQRSRRLMIETDAAEWEASGAYHAAVADDRRVQRLLEGYCADHDIELCQWAH